MTETEFLDLADLTLKQIEDAFDRLNDEDVIDVECKRSGNVLEIEAPVSSRLGQLISVLDLGTRAVNCLAAEGISTLRDLVARTPEQLHELRNAAEVTVHEIEEKLAEHGLKLGMDTEE